MAPSRGLQLSCTLRSFTNRRSAPHRPVQAARTPTWLTRARRPYSSFTDNLSNPAHKLQSYVSRSNDPYLNLSIEDHILRKSPPDSTVLLLYVNRPCVVIGRNQNPWSEVNLGILNAATGSKELKETEPPGIGMVDIVRRRSGGGAVFHDEGNLNWSITCPRTEFTRDKHAEMVVRALRKQGIERARVNERHDIVLDQGHEKRASDPKDTHRTPYTVDEGIPKPLKVSGSAYKLTRQRALHHATTLLESPNLHIISQYLRSPAKHNIEAKGVESVSSPVSNIGLDLKAYKKRLQEVFAEMYASVGKIDVVETVGDEYLNIPDIRKGYDELRTLEWMWAQTPQFDVKLDFIGGPEITMNVHHGIIKSFDVETHAIDDTHEDLRVALVGTKLQDVTDWSMLLQANVEPFNDRCVAVAQRLEELLPVPEFPRR
ncbi:Biotin/lipoate A/B protein ligase [Didymella keratinophila]|nr:Biotin/lipoate A/B protein ligase [Didymella keratinophila]